MADEDTAVQPVEVIHPSRGPYTSESSPRSSPEGQMVEPVRMEAMKVKLTADDIEIVDC